MKPSTWLENKIAVIERRLHQKILCPLGIHDFGLTKMFDCFYCDKPNPPENWNK